VGFLQLQMKLLTTCYNDKTGGEKTNGPLCC
jgi:hypothetical protein